MARVYGQWAKDGDWHVRHEKTTKSFLRFRVEAVRALSTGLSGLVNTHEWKGRDLHVSTIGADGIVTWEPRTITCKVRVSLPFFFMTKKVLSDVGAMTVDVAGAQAIGDRDVFIVHGHNDSARTQLRDILSGMGLNPIVLVEQNDLGFTVIEKFEYYARTCSFAFVLMTPDDQSIGIETNESLWRARQNVVMELGWFMAHLGRERVAILHQGELEIPSDILGVVTIRFERTVNEVASVIAARVRDAGLLES